MSYMDQITTPGTGAIVMTVLGDSGLGKTRLAAAFPKPIFIRAEDGMKSIPEDERPEAFPLLGSVDEFWGQLTELIQQDHDYKTVVIDSVTAIERMFEQYVVDNDPKKPRSINQANGGYGNGPKAVGEMHQKARRGAQKLVDRGIHVVFIAHADMERVEPPDETGYTRYNLRLGKRSIAPYVDDSDVVGFIKLETFTRGDEGKEKAVSDGTRVLVCYATAANVSKNRFGISEDLPFDEGTNPLIPYIDTLNA